MIVRLFDKLSTNRMFSFNLRWSSKNGHFLEGGLLFAKEVFQ